MIQSVTLPLISSRNHSNALINCFLPECTGDETTAIVGDGK